MPIPAILLQHLQTLRPHSKFSGIPPKVQSSEGESFYVKVGDPGDVDQFVGEVESLKAIHEAAPGLAPKLLASGTENGRPYFISQYMNLGGLSDQSGRELGKRLALELHQYTSDKGFGFHVPTYCGATRMKNGWFGTWEECYSEKIKDLLNALKTRGRYEELCKKGEQVRSCVIPKLLGPLDIKPVLLHGDLWSGNTGVENGHPVVFDPSSFYGHSEADLAIARIFGGIPASFFKAYHEHLPKTEPVDQYELRGELYEMFHYLNHTVLFGSSYASSAERKMDVLLRALKEEDKHM